MKHGEGDPRRANPAIKVKKLKVSDEIFRLSQIRDRKGYDARPP